MTFSIANCNISTNHQPFIIAEMSGNHNGSLDRALEIVDAAAASGVQAIKLQTYTADTMTVDLQSDDFFIDDPNSLWKNQSLYSLYSKASTPWEWHEKIFKRARAKGLICFSTPFDDSSVDFLENFDMPCYKIASFECVDLPLIQKVASTGKPIIISTGAASISEINDAIIAARTAGCSELALLKCTSSYPASPKHINLNTIPHMRDLFECEIGVSDHTLGIGVSIAGIALGATIIEKHFTLDCSDGGVDSSFSLDPAGMKALVDESKRAWLALGGIKYGPTSIEGRAVERRRSLYITEDVKAGDKLTTTNMRRIRPGKGLSPKYYYILLGKKVCKNARKGTPLSWDLIE
jgi:N-acetylneuraminate synthase